MEKFIFKIKKWFIASNSIKYYVFKILFIYLSIVALSQELITFFNGVFPNIFIFVNISLEIHDARSSEITLFRLKYSLLIKTGSHTFVFSPFNLSVTIFSTNEETTRLVEDSFFSLLLSPDRSIYFS